MSGTGIGIILFACICSISIHTVFGFGETCIDDTNCTQNSEVCNPSDKTCVCDTSNNYFYIGSQCVLNIDECSSNPCGQNGACVDGVNSYVCNCAAGYTGTHCEINIDECSSNPCGQNGNCVDGVNRYVCNCAAGYTGTHCETDINECSSNPCGQNGACVDGVNRYVCNCAAGYTGTHCDQDIDECSSNPCGQNGNCVDGVNRYVCNCAAGYTGTHCKINIDECSSNPCGQNGVCEDDVNRYVCNCAAGYTGTHCETNIDECSSNPCGQNGACEDRVNSYVCNCAAGYTGTHCDQNINECSSNPCGQNGVCVDGVNSYVCNCAAGYTGTHCDQNINECSSNPCGQNGACVDGVNRYVCNCAAGYTGTHCDQNIDECSSNPCLNGGKCTDKVADFSCACPPGFSSKTCAEAALGASCALSGTSCKDLNTECGSRQLCRCLSSYYDSDGTDNIGGTCLQRKGLGTSCSGFANECADSAAECLDRKCTCGSDHYDSNGFIAGGSCFSISNLKVKEISIPPDSVATSGFKVTWTRPDKASFVNTYLIEWRPKFPDNSLNGGSGNVESSETSFVISSGVTAGKTYTVIVTSKNTETQSNVPRLISLSKEQAAKPNKPGAINKSNSDLHASAGNAGITLYWARPSGGVSGYKVTLSDASNKLSSQSVSEGVNFNPLWLKDGHRYNVTIQAKSETYEGRNVVLGEVYREEIKTVVTEPTAPRYVACKEIFDESIVLEWQSPLMPNGDLVRYTVNVYDSQQANLFTNSTSGVANTFTVENLKPGTHYTFKVFTQNEQYMSTTSGDKTCQTKAKSVIHGSTNILYIYVVITVDHTPRPIALAFIIIPNHINYEPSNLENMCESSVRDILPTTKSDLAATLSYQFVSLLPDTTYTIIATAIISNGRGNVAKITQTTNEEVPQAPFSVEISDIKTTSFLVAWDISGDRPGKTNFTVFVTADDPASSKNITVTGFFTRNKLVDNLEEFWNYVVSVEATTSLGSRKSSPTASKRTLPAAPGQVSDFQITDAPGWNYTQMKVTWKAPGILKRNSIIKEYVFEYFSEENSRFQQSLQHETTDTYVYTVFVDVRPEQTYTVQVYAVNVQNQDGEKTIKSKTTPAGVPISIEYTMHVNIISAYEMIGRRQGMFSVTIVPEFFEESTYGRIRATGLLACAKNCDFSRIKTLQDFNGLRNWKQAFDDGFTLYRVTNPAWLLNLYAQIPPCSGRRKRDVRSRVYTVGQDDCTDVASDEYCNGPISPNTDFVLVAVSCTNGGCLLSKEYGPFSTIPAPTSTVQDCTTETVIVGVVLGLLIVILSVYAGYVTVLNRRYRRRKDYSQEQTAKKKNKKEQLYVNELMTARTARVEERPSNPAIIKEPESEYSRLDAATREEKSEMIGRRQGMFSVTIVPEFFEESTYGMIRATGLLTCAKNCDISTPICTVQDCNCATQTVIVGVVFRLLIVILSVYAGYVTVLYRRYRRRKDYNQEHTAKERNKKEQLYVNELMTVRSARVEERPSNPAMIREPESEYSRLDDATREEK